MCARDRYIPECVSWAGSATVAQLMSLVADPRRNTSIAYRPREIPFPTMGLVRDLG